MPIRIICPACEEKMRVGEEHAGKRFKCRKCGQALTVPAPDDPLESRPESSNRSTESFGDTFSPDPLPAGVRSSGSGSEAVPWETYRVGLKVASWAAMLGLVGSFAYGLGVVIPLSMANDPARFGGGGGPRGGMALIISMMIPSMMILMMVGGIAVFFQLAYATAAASVCGSAEISGNGARLGRIAALLFRLSVMTVVALPLTAWMGFGLLVLLLVTICVLTYLAGYAVFAVGMGGVAAEMGRERVKNSAFGFLILQIVIAGWYMLTTFVLSGGRQPRPIGGPMGAPFTNFGTISMVIGIVAAIVHFLWFRDIVRQTLKEVAEHQESLMGSA